MHLGPDQAYPAPGGEAVDHAHRATDDDPVGLDGPLPRRLDLGAYPRVRHPSPTSASHNQTAARADSLAVLGTGQGNDGSRQHEVVVDVDPVGLQGR